MALPLVHRTDLMPTPLPGIEAEWPQGDPESFTCRHCGNYRLLTAPRPGRPRALICAVCDAPDPSTLVGR